MVSPTFGAGIGRRVPRGCTQEAARREAPAPVRLPGPVRLAEARIPRPQPDPNGLRARERGGDGRRHVVGPFGAWHAVQGSAGREGRGYLEEAGSYVSHGPTLRGAKATRDPREPETREDQGSVRSTDNLSRTDLVYAGLIAAFLGLLTLLPLLGYHFAAFALPFAAGGAAGYGASRVAASARVPRWVGALAVLSAAMALIWGSLSLILPLLNPGPGQGLQSLDPSGSGTALKHLAFSFGFVYFGEVFQRVAFPMLYPRTAEEDDIGKAASGCAAH